MIPLIFPKVSPIFSNGILRVFQQHPLPYKQPEIPQWGHSLLWDHILEPSYQKVLPTPPAAIRKVFVGNIPRKLTYERENHPWIKMYTPYLLLEMVIFHFSEGKHGKSKGFSINTNTSSFILYCFPGLIHRNKRVTLHPNLNFSAKFLLYQWSKDNSFTKISNLGNLL